MKISLLAALSENSVIGKHNKLPWHIPEDLKRFKELTMGHPIIMGRKTYDSIGKPLSGRTNIIVTRDSAKRIPGVIVVGSIDSALKKAKTSPGSDEVFVIGGGEIFKQIINDADKLYLTIVHEITDGDVFFPEYTLFHKIVFKQSGESNGYRFTYLDLEK